MVEPAPRPVVASLVASAAERLAMSGSGSPRLDAELERVEEDLRQRLGTKVTLSRSRKGGRIVIEYYSDEELERLYDRLIGGPA